MISIVPCRFCHAEHENEKNFFITLSQHQKTVCKNKEITHIGKHRRSPEKVPLFFCKNSRMGQIWGKQKSVMRGWKARTTHTARCPASQCILSVFCRPRTFQRRSDNIPKQIRQSIQVSARCKSAGRDMSLARAVYGYMQKNQTNIFIVLP